MIPIILLLLREVHKSQGVEYDKRSCIPKTGLDVFQPSKQVKKTHLKKRLFHVGSVPVRRLIGRLRHEYV